MSENPLKKGRYTHHSNKIGLYAKGENRSGFLNHNDDIVLSFPFKDAILEAGMNKEDVGREERFLHLEMDGKDIDVLFEPKVLTNFGYFTQTDNGQSSLPEIFDVNGKLKQNLLIKGNNLLALHSLKTRLTGAVKLIYIDPPYNTGNDSFKYNDNFNHSSWLVFMKNRLEVAKDLLSDDGVIFVQCDDNEQAYLKVLMDEVFGRENFIGVIPRLTSAQRPSQEKYFSVNHDYILIFAKNKIYNFKNIIERDFSQEIFEDNIGKFFKNDTSPILASSTQGYSKGGDYDVEINGRIYQPIDSKGNRRRWLWTKERMDKAIKLGIVVETKTTLRVRNYINKEYQLKTNIMVDKNPNLSLATYDLMNSIYVNKVGTNELTDLGFNTFNFPKPESLLKRIIELATNKNDIVLDYHLGSGTTCAVAHKMGRRWIGIEQMDYIEDITKVRLQHVLNGEQGGISKVVDWQGGGSFVYFELKKYNQYFIDKILTAQNMGELDTVYNEMAKNAFFKFWFDKDEFQLEYKKDNDNNATTLDCRKKMLVSILDENQLYLNMTDIDDSRYQVSENEKTLSKTFYGEK